MAILSKGTTFSDGDQLTSDSLNNLVDNSTFASDAVDDSTTQLSSGKIIVKDLGVSTGKLAASAVTTAKIADSNVTKAKIENLADYKVLGNVSGGAAAPAEVAILDEDNMSSNSATSLATQQSIKAYVDTQLTAEDLDFAGDSGSSSVDLDGQTFTIAGATGLDTAASGQTLTVSLDLNELATETSIAQDDFLAMVDNTDSGNGKITFSNLEDQIFGNVSGSVAIAAGGAATVSAVTVADESSDTTCFPLFATAATGSLGPKSGSNLTFNSSTGLLTATTLSGILANGVTGTTQSSGDNSTKVATTAYVDAQVATSDALSEVLAVGNTTGSTNIVVSNGQSITTNTIAETTSASGVTVDSLLIKDGGITAAGTSTFAGQTISNLGTVTTANIDGGSIDGTAIGANSASTGVFTTVTASGEIDGGSLDISGDADIDGTLEADAITIGGTAIGSLFSPLAGGSDIVTTGALNSGSITSGFGNIDIGSSNLTATGTISLGSTSFNDNNITNVGSIALDTITNDGTDVTIDSSGDIILDADGAQVRIKDAGTERFIFNTGTAAELDVIGNSFTIHANTSNASMIFKGNDGGVSINALTFDMSAAGAATFNDKIIATELEISGDVDVDGTLETDALSIAGTTVTSTAAELNYLDITTLGTSEASKAVTVDSNGDLLVPDSDKFKFGTGSDMQVYHDGTNSYIANSTGELKLATETSGIAIAIGHSTSEATFGDNVTITGDLTVNGTTTTVNTTNLTVTDPLVKFGEGYTGSAFDEGFIVTRGDGSSSNTANKGFIWDETADEFAAIACNTEDGTTAGNVTINSYADLQVGKLTGGSLDISGAIDVLGTTNLDVVDIDGAVDMAANLTVNGDLILKGGGSGSIVVNDEDSSLCPTMTFLRNGGGTTTNDFIKFENSGGEVATINAAGGAFFSGNLDVDGTTNLDAVDIDGAVQIDSTLTVGVNDTGHDVKFFGATSGAYMHWDESTDDLILGGAARLGIGTTSPGAKLSVKDGNIGIDGSNSPQQFYGAGGNIAGTDTSGGVLTVVGHSPNATGDLSAPPYNGSNFIGAAGLMARGFSESGQYRGSLEFFTKTASAANATSRMLISHDGDVGIGTATPAHKLQVSEASTDFAALITNSTSSGNGLKINAGDNSGDRVIELNDKDGTSRMQVTALGSLSLTTDGSTNTSSAIVINSSGTNFESDGGMIRLLHPSTGSGALTGGFFMKFNANSADKLTVKGNGDLAIAGALSKGSGSFKIPHPLESKKDTHNLVHSFLEGPQADLLYRGRVDLVDGVASVNIDEASDMTDGTFVILCRDIQSFTTNESGWTAVRSSVDGNILTIEAQDNTCTDSISWMVVGERQDQHMYDTEWTDENGKVVVEPLIPEPIPEPEEELTEEE